MAKKLFTFKGEVREWGDIRGMGFSEVVPGALFTASRPPCCGVPMGGIGTGCLDIDARGIYGWSTIFNPGYDNPKDNNRATRALPVIQPVLGLATGGKTWVLTTKEMIAGEEVEWCTSPVTETGGAEKEGEKPVNDRIRTPKVEGVETVKDIQYWGHFPVADLEYETDAPVSVGMRAWAPFVPGDAAASNIPAAVFEVHLRNESGNKLNGTLVFNFPGPTKEEARATEFSRQAIIEDYQGMLITAAGGWASYLLGVIGNEPVRFGAGFIHHPDAWKEIGTKLPQPAFRETEGGKLYQDSSCSAAVDFDLGGGEEKVVRFVLAWYAPDLEGTRRYSNWTPKDETEDAQFFIIRWIGTPQEGNTHYWTHMYASRYGSAVEVARRMVSDHQSLLKKVLAWQEVVYQDTTLPAWLRDALVNNLALITEDSYWFQARPPLGDFCYPYGMFTLNESPRSCPHYSCIPCDWYGNLPIVFFFPELARANLRAFKQYQLESGEVPFAIGHIGDLPDAASPEYYWQVSLNGMCYVDMVDRVWQRTGDMGVLKEFYESVKKCNTFTINLRKGPGGPISMPEIGGMEWFEFGDWAGMAAHMGGLRLAELRIMERMAQTMGDTEYVKTCQVWLAEGQRAMEEDMWTGTYYLNFWEKETGKKSDDVMAYQLDGEWTARFHGLPGVFKEGRVKIALDTIRRTNVVLTPDCGAANFARPEGKVLSSDSKVAFYGQYSMFTPEVVVLGMTYFYAGEKDYAIEFCRKYWRTLALKHGHAWDMPTIVSGDDGRRIFGTDYYQDMMLWAIPATMIGDIKLSCQSGTLIDRVIRAGLA